MEQPLQPYIFCIGYLDAAASKFELLLTVVVLLSGIIAHVRIVLLRVLMLQSVFLE